MDYDEFAARAYLAGIAAQVDRPVVEASLAINGLEVVSQPGQIGRQLDIPASMTPIELHMRAMTDGLLPLVIHENPPTIFEVDQAAGQARNILSAPLVLAIPDAQPGVPASWTVEREQLATMLNIQRVDSASGSAYQVLFDVEKLRPLLVEAAPKLSRQPANARFIFNDETRQLDLLQPSVTGRSLNIDATLQTIQTELPAGNHNLNLAVDTLQPAVTSEATGEQLGIRELVSEHTSYFFGSSAARIQNIQTAAERFHGVLVAPGATFSMAEILGDISLDNGYAEALIIFGDRTIEGVGGGVCQVSTTLFRTAFLGGFPIVERHPHAYRVGYYEQNSSGHINPNFAGLDATVFVPIVDLKFVNDTPNWLLMETYFSGRGRKLTWKFYSTSDGRTVDWDTTGLQNVVEPPEPKYIENGDLGKGEMRQVDWAVAGGDVTISRVVTRNGEVYLSDQFVTHYQPWRDIYEYGPGTKIPKD
jgi:vancomycin resistance protein YoaR